MSAPLNSELSNGRAREAGMGEVRMAEAIGGTGRGASGGSRLPGFGSGLRLGADRTQELLSPVNLHLAGVAILVLMNLYLLIHLGMAWRSAYQDNADALEQQTIEMTGAEIAARPLRGLDSKLGLAGEEAAKFYRQRIPTDYSTVLVELGALAKKNNVRLTRVQYTQGPSLTTAAVAGSHADVGAEEAGLTEIRMDASLSGDYRPLVQFVNGLERDKVFFLIGGVTLTGQQTGVVNLRMKLTTFLRPPTPEEKTALEKANAGKLGPSKLAGTDETGAGTATPDTGAARVGTTGARPTGAGAAGRKGGANP